MNKTIYIVSWNGCDQIGGLERVVGIWKRILEKEYKVVILDKEYLRKNPFWNKLYVSEHPVWLMILFSLCALKCKRKGGIIIGNGFNAPFVRKDISVVHQVMYVIKKNLGQPVWSGSTLFERIALRNSERVIAVTQAVKEEAIQYYNIAKKRIRVIHNCIDTTHFYPIRHSMRVKAILFSGRLESVKGVDELYQLALYVSRNDNIRLLIATTDPKRDNKFSKLRNVEIWYGLKLEEMNSFYNQGDVLYVPSLYESFSLVTLESLAAGVPVVGNGVGIIKELVEEEFKGVYQLKSKDVNVVFRQLQTVMSQYSNDFDARMELHSKIEERFGVVEYSQKIMQEIEKCLC